MTSNAEQFSQLKDFLGYIATLRGDLSNVTAPPFVLARKSATEFPASWCSHQRLFLDQGASDQPERRALAVLKNFLACLKTQTYTGASEQDGAKKPLNAFLGELFIAQFDGHGSNTRLISEQVSHHPPVTACYLYNQDHGISAEGYVSQLATFSATHGVKVEQIGHAIIHLDKHAEDHLLTLPTLNVKGILSGAPYPELSGTCYIVSSSGYTSRIEFEGKRLFGLNGSKKNSVHAELYATDNPAEPLYTVTGQWNASFAIADARAGAELETVDVDALQLTPLKPAPLAEQDPWETRRAWADVFAAIDAGDVRRVAQHKGAIEDAQRELRRLEQRDGTGWERRFFRRHDDDPRARELARAVGQELNTERTDGVWRFVGVEEAEKLGKPYHPGVLPTGRTQENDAAQK